MGSVRTAEGISRMLCYLIVNCFNITGWQHHITVEHDQVLTTGMLCTIVTRLSRSAILFCKIMKIQFVGVSAADILARHLTAVFNDDHLKVFLRLVTKTLQQLIHLIRAVVHGDNDGVLHR